VTEGELIEDQVRGCLSGVVGRRVLPGETVVRGEEPAWDSLAHVELLFALEDEFGIRFDRDELGSMGSLRDLVDSVARHRGHP